MLEPAGHIYVFILSSTPRTFLGAGTAKNYFLRNNGHHVDNVDNAIGTGEWICDNGGTAGRPAGTYGKILCIDSASQPGACGIQFYFCVLQGAFYIRMYYYDGGRKFTSWKSLT